MSATAQTAYAHSTCCFIYLFFPQAKKNFILINMQIVSVRITTI